VPLPDKEHSDREITYRVGWKKGVIHVPDSAGKSAVPAAHSGAEMKGAGAERPAVPFFLKAAPFPGLKAAAVFALALPAAAFAAIVWLTAKLAEARFPG
jgi:hypothetical protein